VKTVKQEILKRGFKASAERIAVDYRTTLGLGQADPLCAFKLSAHLGISIFTPDGFSISASDVNNIQGTKSKDSGWSALTMVAQSGNRIIIHNGNHSPARQQSNIMHELAHVICKHEQPSPFNHLSLPLSMRDYNAKQELEANTLGPTLLLPRPALIWALKGKMSIAEIASHYTASEEMVKFRIKMTGVMRQIQYMN
jgi:Zn-dependent peptidase ImmA (M78 family)